MHTLLSVQDNVSLFSLLNHPCTHAVIVAGALILKMAALNIFNISEEAIKVIEENSIVKSTKDAPEFGKNTF